MPTKTEALELCRRAIESRCNEHGSIHEDDLADVLQDVINDLVPEDPDPEPVISPSE